MSMPPVTDPSEDQVTPPEVLPLLPIDNAVLFPAMLLPLVVSGDAWVKLVDDTALGSKLIGVFWRRQPGDTFDPRAGTHRHGRADRPAAAPARRGHSTTPAGPDAYPDRATAVD